MAAEKLGIIARSISTSKDIKTITVTFLVKISVENEDDKYELVYDTFTISNDLQADIEKGWEYGNIVEGYDLMTEEEVEEEIEKSKNKDRGRQKIMNYKIIKMTSRNNVVKYRFEIFIDFGEHTEVIAPHFGFLTEQKAIAEAQKEIRRQEKEMEKIRKIASK